jgi:hypothetical protein
MFSVPVENLTSFSGAGLFILRPRMNWGRKSCQLVAVLGRTAGSVAGPGWFAPAQTRAGPLCSTPPACRHGTVAVDEGRQKNDDASSHSCHRADARGHLT